MSSFYTCRIYCLSCLIVLLVQLVHPHTGVNESLTETADRCRLSSGCEEVHAGIFQSRCMQDSFSRPVLYTYIYTTPNPADVNTRRGSCGAQAILYEFANNRDKAQPLEYNLPYNGTGQPEIVCACDPVMSGMTGLGITPRLGTKEVTGSAEADYNQTTKTLTTFRTERDAMIFCILLNSGMSPVQIERV